VQAFANNPDVAFGDVNLSEEQIRGNHNPGEGGWPTIRFFNNETGYEGKSYKKKTDDAMCDELGNDMYMSAYVEEAGRTFLCRASDGAGCSDKEVKFIGEWQGKGGSDIDAQLHRLNGMAASGMRAELKGWVLQRLAILKQLKPKEEL
jgi:hypothetical protein